MDNASNPFKTLYATDTGRLSGGAAIVFIFVLATLDEVFGIHFTAEYVVIANAAVVVLARWLKHLILERESRGINE